MEVRCWTFMGATRRNVLSFSHNTITGNRTVKVNDIVLRSTGWKFSLTGTMLFEVDEKTIEIVIRADSMTGRLMYVCSVDKKEILPDGVVDNDSSSSSTRGTASTSGNKSEKLKSTFVLQLQDGFHQIEFVWSSMDVLLDGVRVMDAESSFDGGDDEVGTVSGSCAGSTFKFQLPSPLPNSTTTTSAAAFSSGTSTPCTAILTATPATAAQKREGSNAMITTLRIDPEGVSIPQSELLGAEGGGGEGGGDM